MYNVSKLSYCFKPHNSVAFVVASQAVEAKQWSGKIVVRSKSGIYKLSIPYQASVLHG